MKSVIEIMHNITVQCTYDI